MFVALWVTSLCTTQTPLLRLPIEVSVAPFYAQVNANNEHLGVGFGAALHLHRVFAVQLSGFFNYASGPSAFDFEVGRKIRPEIAADGAHESLNVWGAFAGFEFAPLQGGSNIGQLSLVLTGAVGLGGTRHQLKPFTASESGTYGDTGLRFLSRFGAGVRVEITRHIGVRIDVQDMLFSDTVQSVNGCNRADLGAMDAKLSMGGTASQANVGASCRASSFEGTDANGHERWQDLPLANNLVKPPFQTLFIQSLVVQLGLFVQF